MSLLTDEHMRTLRCGPLWVVSALLGRAGGFNEAELGALWDSVITTASRARGLPRQVLSALAADRVAALRQLQTSPLPIATALRHIGMILNGADRTSAVEVKRAFLAVGRGVAAARSLGRAISDADAETLELVAALLDTALGQPGDSAVTAI